MTPAPTAARRSPLRGPGGGAGRAPVRLPGRFNVANAVLAVAAARRRRRRRRDGAAGLADTVVPGRMEPVDAGQPFVAVVDYAHTPDAVATALARAARRDRAAG